MVEKTQLGILQVLPAGSDQRTSGLDQPDMRIDNHRMWRGRVVEQVGRTWVSILVLFVRLTYKVTVRENRHLSPKGNNNGTRYFFSHIWIVYSDLIIFPSVGNSREAVVKQRVVYFLSKTKWNTTNWSCLSWEPQLFIPWKQCKGQHWYNIRMSGGSIPPQGTPFLF